MKLIGISSSLSNTQTFVNTSYPNAFVRAGTMPVILPVFAIGNRETLTRERFAEIHKSAIDKLVDSLSGLVLSGGVDINPVTFGQENWAAHTCDGERDLTELALLEAFILAGKPVFGICRGFQLANLYFGLEHFQQDLIAANEFHTSTEREFKERQEAAHSVYVFGDFQAYLHEKAGVQNTFNVNSFHHQGFTITSNAKLPKEVRFGEVDYAEWFAKVIAKYEKKHSLNIIASTGMVIEGVEKPEQQYVGVQWHPEEYGNNGLTIQYWLDRYVLNKA